MQELRGEVDACTRHRRSRTLITAEPHKRGVEAAEFSSRLHSLAVGLIEIARGEQAEGYCAGNPHLVRHGAELAWLSALQGVEGAMTRKGLIPDPGAMNLASKHTFLESAGRGDLSEALFVFEDWLHERMWWYGALPGREEADNLFDEVERFVRELSA